MSRYFTEKEFKEDYNPKKVDELLQMVYEDEGVLPTTELCIEFFMMSNDLDKLEIMEGILEDMGYDIDSTEEFEDGCELIAITTPMRMDADVVKKWYEELWKIGFKNDCKLDGWHILTD